MKNKIWVVLFFVMIVGNVGAATGFQGLFPYDDVPGQEAVVTGRKQGLKCEYCGKVCVSPSALKTHIRSHTGEKPCKCKFAGCDKSFADKANLKKHERIHTGEKPFKCTFEGCDKSFNQVGNLRAHERFHAGEKPYKCEVCDRLFTQNSNRNAHQRRVHGFESRSEKTVKSDEDQEWAVEDLEELRNGLFLQAVQTIPSLGLTNLEKDKAEAGIALFGLTQEEIANVIKIDELGDVFGNGVTYEE